MIEAISQVEHKLAQVIKDFPTCCAKLFKIKTTDKKIKPLILRKGQQRIWEKVKYCLDNNLPIRIIILKARQVGISTICEAIVFWLTVFRKNVNSLIIADEELRAKALFEMSKRFYKHLDDEIPYFKPDIQASNRKELVFAKIGSQFIIEMATKVKGGRTFTLQNVHASEAAFYQNPEELFTATLPSMPYKPGTCFIIESTSAGYGGWFHDQWKRAVKGESNFIPIFISWYDWEEYSLPHPSRMHLTLAEKELRDKVLKYAGVKLTLDQLYWRRVMIRDLNQGGESGLLRFQREFPSTPDEAFIAESNLYFPAESLELIVPKKPKKGFLYRTYTRINPVIKFKEKEEEKLHVWYPPEIDDKGNPLNRYVIGADTGAGTGSDYSVVEVVDKRNMRQCAEYRSNRVHSDQLADIIENIARWYNDALVGIELNRGEGIAVQDRLMETYGNVYYRETYDAGLREYTTKPGWYTTTKSRPIMLSRLREVIRNALLEINSHQALEELKSFMVIDGKPQGVEDDCVIALAIALQLYDYIPSDIYDTKVPEFWKEMLDPDNITGYY